MSYGIRICNLSPHYGQGKDRYGKLWRWDFGEHVGPTFLKKNGEPLERQPTEEKHPAWEPFNKWLAEKFKKGPAYRPETVMNETLHIYQCFKQVRAAQIADIKVAKPVNNDLTKIMARTLFFIDQTIPPVSVAEAVYQKHQPKVGWYLVQYEDGYTSFSPPETFEAGYARIDTPDEAATPLKAAFLAKRAAEAETVKVRQEARSQIDKVNDENRRLFNENHRLKDRIRDLGGGQEA